MNARIPVSTALAMACCWVSEVEAQGVPSSLDFYATLATDYLHRGMSQTDGDVAVQVGLDYRHRSGFFAGAWASNVDYEVERPRARSREREIDYYLGFDDRGQRWSWTGTLAHYTYPDAMYDYDYTELSFGASFKGRFSYRVTYADDLLSVGYTSLGHEFDVKLPLPANTELGITLGHLRSSDLPDDGFSHYNVGLSKLLDAFTLDLRYYDTDFANATLLGRPADARWVVSVSYGFSAF